MYYEKILFKCWLCHDYGHFAKNCTNNILVEKKAQEKDA
jgi:hypothetical protein